MGRGSAGASWRGMGRGCAGAMFKGMGKGQGYGKVDGQGLPLDPSNGMLQIAAYLQHICCTWQFLKSNECSKDKTQDIVSLESNYTSNPIS